MDVHLPPDWRSDLGTEGGIRAEMRAGSLLIQGTPGLRVYDAEGNPLLLATESGGLEGFDRDGNYRFIVRRDGAIVLPSLPTSDPLDEGVAWNDGGYLRVSLG